MRLFGHFLTGIPRILLNNIPAEGGLCRGFWPPAGFYTFLSVQSCQSRQILDRILLLDLKSGNNDLSSTLTLPKKQAKRHHNAGTDSEVQ